MAYYDIYDGNDNLVASNVYIDESSNGGGSSIGGIAILLWIAYTLSPFVMIYFCINTYFDGTDQLFYRICSALPMIISIIINLIVDYIQLEFIILKFITLKNHVLKSKNNQEINENEDDEKIKKSGKEDFQKLKILNLNF